MPTPVTINLTKILIDRDPMTKIPKTVPPWHVPVYRAQFGTEKVQIVGAQPSEYEDTVDPHTELEAMKAQFGKSEDGRSYVDLAYGGIAEDAAAKLEKAINASYLGDPEKAQALVDGKRKIGADEAEARDAAYIDPATKEPLDPKSLTQPAPGKK